MTELETIILVAQIIILIIELYLSWYFYKKSNESEKGFFVINETNILHSSSIPNEHFKDVFDLRKNIGFKVVGNSNVFVLGSKVQVDGVTIHMSSTPYETIYTMDKRFNIFKEEHLAKMNLNYFDKDKIDVKIDYYLKNDKNYKYTEEITMQFTKDKKCKDNWLLTKYNMIFK